VRAASKTGELSLLFRMKVFIAEFQNLVKSCFAEPAGATPLMSEWKKQWKKG
jgi:hypothetical protein